MYASYCMEDRSTQCMYSIVWERDLPNVCIILHGREIYIMTNLVYQCQGVEYLTGIFFLLVITNMPDAGSRHLFSFDG